MLIYAKVSLEITKLNTKLSRIQKASAKSRNPKAETAAEQIEAEIQKANFRLYKLKEDVERYERFIKSDQDALNELK